MEKKELKELDESKYLGIEIEGFKVIKAFLRNEYLKQYGYDKKPRHHKEYAFTLENKDKDIIFTISGNQLRSIINKKITIREMLTSTKGGGAKNPEICAIKRRLIETGWDNLGK